MPISSLRHSALPKATTRKLSHSRSTSTPAYQYPARRSHFVMANFQKYTISLSLTQGARRWSSLYSSQQQFSSHFPHSSELYVSPSSLDFVVLTSIVALPWWQLQPCSKGNERSPSLTCPFLWLNCWTRRHICYVLYELEFVPDPSSSIGSWSSHIFEWHPSSHRGSRTSSCRAQIENAGLDWH